MKIKNKFVGNAAIYLGANILNAGIPFLLLPILTRVLTPADYGVIAMFSIALSIFGAFTGLSVHGAISVRYFQMEKNQLAEYVGACVGILILSTAVVLVLVTIFGEWLAALSSVPPDWLMIAVVLSGLQFIVNIRLTLWQVAGQAKKYGTFQLSQSLLNAFISLLLILVIGMAWQGRVIGQAVAILLFGGLSVWWLLRDNMLRVSRNWRVHTADALKFGVPLVPHIIGALLIVAVDRFVIVRLLDVAQAGIYMVALQVGQVIGLFTESVNKAYAPWLMKKLSNQADVPRIAIVRGTYLYFVLILLMAMVFGFLAPLFLEFLVGESFRAAGAMVIYIALGFAFGGCYYMVTNYVFFESKTWFLALITFTIGLINIPLMIYLVTINGLVGAAQAFMLSQMLSFIGTWLFAHKVHPMPWRRAFANR